MFSKLWTAPEILKYIMFMFSKLWTAPDLLKYIMFMFSKLWTAPELLKSSQSNIGGTQKEFIRNFTNKEP